MSRRNVGNEHYQTEPMTQNEVARSPKPIHSALLRMRTRALLLSAVAALSRRLLAKYAKGDRATRRTGGSNANV